MNELSKAWLTVMAVGALGALALSSVGLGAADLTGALAGLALGVGFSLAALLVKAKATLGGSGTAFVKLLLALQGKVFAARMVVVAVGALVAKNLGAPVAPFVLAFFGASLVGQAAELKLTLARQTALDAAQGVSR